MKYIRSKGADAKLYPVSLFQWMFLEAALTAFHEDLQLHNTVQSMIEWG